MPLVVNHDSRRNQIIDIASDLIASGGVEAASVRRIAEAAGCSTGVVSHYFTSIRHLQMLTFRAAAVRGRERAMAVLAAKPGDLEGALMAYMPVDEVRRRDWRVWVAFFGYAISDPDFGEERRRSAVLAREILAKALEERQRKKPLTGVMSPLAEGSHLIAVMSGLAIEAMLEPDEWPPRRQWSAIRRLIDSLAAPLEVS